jgi:hypothetical protein
MKELNKIDDDLSEYDKFELLAGLMLNNKQYFPLNTEEIDIQ